MDKLGLLTAEGARLVGSTLRSGQGVLALVPEAETVEAMARPIPLAGVREVAERALRDFAPFDTRLDRFLAPRLHAALPLTRREAADIRVWRFLSVLAFPALVRHRWENTSWSAMQARFLRPGTRPDSNAFSRWWWVAELTRDGGDYSLCERVFESQALVNAIFVRSLSYYRPVVAACVQVLEGDGGEVIHRVLYELNRWLSLVLLESLTEAELLDRVSVLAERARRAFANAEAGALGSTR